MNWPSGTFAPHFRRILNEGTTYRQQDTGNLDFKALPTLPQCPPFEALAAGRLLDGGGNLDSAIGNFRCTGKTTHSCCAIGTLFGGGRVIAFFYTDQRSRAEAFQAARPTSFSRRALAKNSDKFDLKSFLDGHFTYAHRDQAENRTSSSKLIRSAL